MLEVAVSVSIPSVSLACPFDTDCNPSSKCAKAFGATYGVCIDGISPGNRNDREPVYAPLDPNRTHGNTSSFGTDCGLGSRCVKDRGSIEGACMRAC